MSKNVVVQFSIKVNYQEAFRQKANRALDTESSYLRKLLIKAVAQSHEK